MVKKGKVYSAEQRLKFYKEFNDTIYILWGALHRLIKKAP